MGTALHNVGDAFALAPIRLYWFACFQKSKFNQSSYLNDLLDSIRDQPRPPEESPRRTELEATFAKYRAASSEQESAEPTDQRRTASTDAQDDPPDTGR